MGTCISPQKLPILHNVQYNDSELESQLQGYVSFFVRNIRGKRTESLLLDYIHLTIL